MSDHLRKYQIESVEAVFREWDTVDGTLLDMATGLGKGVILVEIVKRLKPKRVLVLVNRRKLVHQLKGKFETFSDMTAEIEMAGERVHLDMLYGCDVVISSVQSQTPGRRSLPSDFDVVVVDECHLVRPANKSFMDVINHYRQNPNLKLLGLSATPSPGCRSVFKTVAYSYGIKEGIQNGYLVGIDQKMVHIHGLDYSHVRTVAGDLNAKDLAAIMEDEKICQGMIQATLEVMFGVEHGELTDLPVERWAEFLFADGKPRKNLVFTASVAQAKMMSDIFNRIQLGLSEWVCSDESLVSEEKRKTIDERFEKGDLLIVCNQGIYCLDSETEILTSNGWVGMDSTSYKHKVANWDDGKVFFDNPQSIIRRDRLPSERMVVLETKKRSIRVTENHNLIYRSAPRCAWKKTHAENLVGKVASLPISGIAGPLEVKMPGLWKSKRLRCVRVAANAHMLRNNNGFEWERSTSEANRRIDERDALAYKHPSALTLDECEFIGFWLGDGSVNKLKRGGVAYTLCQFADCSNIVSRVDDLILSCGFDCVRKVKPSRGTFAVNPNSESKVVAWTLSRGTGFGSQKRRGVFALEPYLQKHGSNLLWGLNETQFDALLIGYWMADGEHLNNARPPKPILRICGARPELFSLLQAIACVRGYRTSLIKRPNGKHWLWFLSCTKRDEHTMTKYRLRFEDGWNPERVWCVTSTSGNIITRRRGTVTVVGNSIGYDNPKIQMVTLARGTESLTLCKQQCGRGTRTEEGVIDGIETVEGRLAAIAASGKPVLTCLDFVGNFGKHNILSTADILGDGYDDEAKARAKKKAEKSNKPQNILALLKESESEIAAERGARKAEAERIEAARKAHVVAKADYTITSLDPFERLQVKKQAATWWDKKNAHMLSANQRYVLREKIKVDPDGLSISCCRSLLGKHFGQPTPGQAKVLTRFGYSLNVPMKKASAIIDALAKNGWQKPLEAE